MKHLRENSAVLLNRLQNLTSDVSLPQLMRIAIEGPELTDVNLKKFGQQNRLKACPH